MRRLAPLLLAAASALTVPVHAHASDDNDAARRQASDALMADYHGQGPGAALLVLKHGQVLHARGYGLADLDTGQAVDTRTNFRLASVSKQFTAMAVLLLAADGSLQLDDPLAHWLPGLPPATASVTLRHLLVHASGLVDYEDHLPAGLEHQLRDADVLAILRGQDRTYFPPGSGYRYSNSGYALLALVVEKASGQAYADFLRQRLFLPLGMANTQARTDEGPAIARRAYGYSLVDGRWQRSDQSLTSAVLGDGGIYSSAEDLSRWLAELDAPRVLPAALVSQALSAANPVHGEANVSHYGLGWRLHPGLAWHSGESIGFRNVLIRFPEQRLDIVLLSNRNDPEPYALARRIAALWGAPEP